MVNKALSNLSSLANRAKGGKQVLRLSTDDVVPRKQTRTVFAGIEELGDTIEQFGQIQPIVVKPKNAEGKYVIEKGERRWRACKLKGLPVDAIVNDTEQSAQAELITELLENDQRDDLTPLDRAEAYKRLSTEHGLTMEEIAKSLGHSKTFVGLHMALLKMPDCVRDLYDCDEVRDPEVLNTLRMLCDVDPALGEQVCAEARTNGITRSRSRDLLKDAKARSKGGATHKALTPDVGPTQEPEHRLPGAAGADESSTVPLGSLNNQQVPDKVQEQDQKTPGSTPEIQPPESPDTNKPANPPSPKQTPKSQGFVDVAPQSWVLRVMYHLEDDESNLRLGTVMTGRIDNDPDYMWIVTDNSPVRVLVSSVTISAVEATA